jgi:drug/metabolite transporter (DMT)-like permease
VKRSDIVQAFIGVCLGGGAHVGCGLLAANSLWGGRDSSAEWTFYYVSAGCCLLPLTGMLAWILTGTESTKRIGHGVVLGLVAVTAVAVLAMIAGYAPPWISAGWTGDGWS